MDNNRHPSNVATIISAFIRTPFDKDIQHSQFEIPILEERRNRTAQVAEGITNQAEKVVSEKLLDPIFGNHPANPSRKDAIDRLRTVFATDAYMNSDEPTDIDAWQTAFENDISRHNYIAIIGERGCGKTLFVNYWLNERSRDFLEETIGYCWFRVDVTKIHQLLDDDDIPDKSRLIHRYFIAHSAYVFLEYSGLSRNPASPNHSESPFLTKLSKQFSNTSDDDQYRLLEAIETIEKHYAKLLHRFSKDPRFPSERAVQYALKSKDVYEAYQVVFNRLCDVLRETDSGLLAIIDGIDNVSWSHGNRRYRAACEDARAFIKSFSEQFRVRMSKIILVTRPETVPELNIPLQTMSLSREQIAAPEIMFKPRRLPFLDPGRVLSIKLEATNSPHFINNKRACIDELSTISSETNAETLCDNVIGSYRSDATKYIDAISSELRRILSDIPTQAVPFFVAKIDAGRILGAVFDMNLRAFLNSFRRSREGRSLHEKIEISGADSPIRVPQFFLVGNRLYIDSTPKSVDETRYSEIPVGEIFPNIFWYDPRLAIGHHRTWHGLAGLRMLQLCNFRTLVAADIMYLLHKLFLYSPRVLTEIVEAFVAYGLLTVEATAEQVPKYCNDSEKYKSIHAYRSVIRTSRKGRIAASLSFYYYDYLYFLSLDTPLHSRYLASSAGDSHLRFFIDPLNGRRDFHFFDALVPTVSTFCRHIFQYHQREVVGPDCTMRMDLKDTEMAEIESAIAPFEYLESVFEIPKTWISHIEKETEKALKTRHDREGGHKHKYNDLVNDVLGRFQFTSGG